MKKTFILILSLFSFFSLSAQHKATYKAETFASFSSGNYTPFWIANQNWGVTSLNSNNFYERGAVFYNLQLNKDWSFETGVDLVGGNKSPYGNFWVQQFYGQLNWKIWRLDIGSRENYTSLLNPSLSSGDFMCSNNSRPFPKIEISMPNYILVPKTKGNVFVKGDFSAGKYLDDKWIKNRAEPAKNNYVQNTLSHQKALFVRFGDIENKHKMQFTFSAMHGAQWGGTIYKYRKNSEGVWRYLEIDEPVRLDDFFRVMIAKEGSPGASDASIAYVAGSQWGAYTFKYDYLLENKSILNTYIQHFFDDGSGMAFENYRDNLLGIEYKSKTKDLLSGVVFEYVYTKFQTGPVHHNIAMDEEHIHMKAKGNGNDNYYNNGDYIQGPSHFGRTQGTPLFLSPAYNTDRTLNFKSNRIIAFHLGAEGYLRPELQYRVMLTHGRSWGRYYMPFTKVKEGISSLVELKYAPPKLRNIDAKLSIGYDSGEFFGGKTFGAGISVIKSGQIF